VFDGDNVARQVLISVFQRKTGWKISGAYEMAKLFIETGVIATAFISHSGRSGCAKPVGPEDFIEAYCSCPLKYARRDEGPLPPCKKGRDQGVHGHILTL
jgi:adenylylsulfate kinase-like enzyme